MIDLLFILQDWLANYYVSLGARKEDILIEICGQGHTFTLADPNSTGVGVPISGMGPAGTYTQRDGYYAAYEVHYFALQSQKAVCAYL